MMKKLGIVLICMLFCLSLNAQSIIQLQAKDFSAKVKEMPNALLMDVRTPAEFSKGYIAGAENIDWKNPGFKDKVANIDPNKTVFVYCLSGVRSKEAANYLQEAGFKNILVLDGGLMKWRAAGLTEAAAVTKDQGLTLKDYNALLKSDKLVLIDFYADWCAPCKEMKPYLDKITLEQKDRVVLVRINADDNKELCKALNVSTLPVLKLYKKEKLTWEKNSLVSEKEILNRLR